MIEGCHEAVLSRELDFCLDDEDTEVLRTAQNSYDDALPFGRTALPGAHLSSRKGIDRAIIDYEGTA